MKKFQMNQFASNKIPVSDININAADAQKWLNQLFNHLPETEYTKDLYETVTRCLDKSETFTDFFVRLIYEFFPDEGLVLLDSADKNLRKLESSYFLSLIENQPHISQGVWEASQQLRSVGYPDTLGAEIDDAHLFYHINHERILLKRDALGNWIGKQDEISLTTDEVRTIAKETPELLSNNVEIG